MALLGASTIVWPSCGSVAWLLRLTDRHVSPTNTAARRRYVAPEILRHSVSWYGPQVDTWSLGVIMFILLVGYPPFTADSQPELFRKIKRGECVWCCCCTAIQR